MGEGVFLGLSPAGFHRVAYTVLGPRGDSCPVICVHGLTQNSHAFDHLGPALGRRMFAPDVVGRGRSDWLADPRHYTTAQYCADMTALIARTGAAEVDWVGISMGGLIGMALASQPGTPIRRLVLIDIGPFLPAAAVRRLASIFESDGPFDTLAGLEAYFRKARADYGSLPDAEWRRMAEQGHRRNAGGGFSPDYDPGIGADMRARPAADVDLWSVYDKIRCPTLVLRGARSDVLSQATAAGMRRRGPRAKVVEDAGAGHAPWLYAPAQISPIVAFLAER